MKLIFNCFSDVIGTFKHLICDSIKLMKYKIQYFYVNRYNIIAKSIK